MFSVLFLDTWIPKALSNKTSLSMFNPKLVFPKENAKKNSVYLTVEKCCLLVGTLVEAKLKKMSHTSHSFLERVEIFELQISIYLFSNLPTKFCQTSPQWKIKAMKVGKVCASKLF